MSAAGRRDPEAVQLTRRREARAADVEDGAAQPTEEVLKLLSSSSEFELLMH